MNGLNGPWHPLPVLPGYPPGHGFPPGAGRMPPPSPPISPPGWMYPIHAYGSGCQTCDSPQPGQCRDGGGGGPIKCPTPDDGFEQQPPPNGSDCPTSDCSTFPLYYWLEAGDSKSCEDPDGNPMSCHGGLILYKREMAQCAWQPPLPPEAYNTSDYDGATLGCPDKWQFELSCGRCGWYQNYTMTPRGVEGEPHGNYKQKENESNPNMPGEVTFY